MDAIKILGDFLQNNRVARGQGRNVLEQIVGGAGASGRRPSHRPRVHAPPHGHSHAQPAGNGLGGLIRAAVEQYGRQQSGHAHQAQREQVDHHRQEHAHSDQHTDHQRQQEELRRLEQQQRQLERERARLQQKHQREEQRHAQQEHRHQQQEQHHAHGQQIPNARPGRFPDDREAANFQAQLLLRAMIYAGKADGCLDQKEQADILSHMGHLSVQEKQFLQHEFNRNISTCDFAREVPAGLEDEVYAVSLASIDLDTNREARYLHELANELELSHEVVNYIHKQVGAPKLYS